MKDHLESQLQNLKFRPLPPSWRREILAATTQVKTASLDTSSLLRFFYPGHYATAALAFIWLFILGLHMTTPDIPKTPGEPISIAQFKAYQFERELIMAQIEEPGLRIQGNKISAPLHQPRS